MKKFLSLNYFYLLILCSICSLLVIKNYTSNTFLSGWDTLHPELNFNLNFQRLINGTWRYEQGLGSASGHSHMADLPRVFFLWILHFFLPLNTLRYSYIFFCLFAGAVGFYFLIKYLFKSNQIAFLGSLAYLLNLGTLQQFFVAFEMFPTQWATLPWLFLTTFLYLKKPHREYLFLFAIVTILSTPQAYAAQLWYAFFVCYILFLVTYKFLNKKSFKLPLILIGLTIILNSFWLLPNLYYIKAESQNPKNYRGNRLYSQEFLAKNQETGNYQDVALLKGFYFNWNIYDFSKKNTQNLMLDWNKYLSLPYIQFIGFSFFHLAILGVGFAIFFKSKKILAFLPSTLITFALLANQLPIFNKVFDTLITFPIFEEALRFVFSKLSILATFFYAIYFANFIYILFNFFNKTIRTCLLILISFSLFIYLFPAFTGNLISKKIEINIPSSYFDFWKYMANQDENGRVLSLPLNDFTGWQYNSWGYQGSGFLWFNLKQPLLNRDFDRWNQKNDQAYREFFYSLYSQNPNDFIQTAHKYFIKYIIWDQSIITIQPKNRDSIIYKDQIEILLKELLQQKKISALQTFGDLAIYQIQDYQPTSKPEFISMPDVGPSYTHGFIDQAYLENGNYYTTAKPQIIYSHRDIFDQTEKVNDEGVVQQTISSEWSYFQHIDKIYQSTNTTNSFSWSMDYIPHSLGYLIGIEAKHLSGFPLRLCVKDLMSQNCVLEEQLSKYRDNSWDYFLLPPLNQDSGYSFILDNISNTRTLNTKNYLSQIKIWPTSYDYFFKQKTQISNQTKRNVLVFPQSFSPSWLAFYFTGLRPNFLANHVLVNNWANGWLLPSNLQSCQSDCPTIYFFFWPQLLEFLGFILIPFGLFFIFRLKTDSLQ